MQKKFHHIARGIIIMDGQVLVAHAKGWDNTFLPGGHIELGESAVTTLPRELQEEIGIRGEVGRFLGLLEADWADTEKGVHHFEISQVFEVASPDLTAGVNPLSAEDHLEFYWVPATLEALTACKLLPMPFRELIATLPERGEQAFWGTTLAK